MALPETFCSKVLLAIWALLKWCRAEGHFFTARIVIPFCSRPTDTSQAVATDPLPVGRRDTERRTATGLPIVGIGVMGRLVRN